MKCIVRKLSEPVNNEALPVLKDIQIKEYAMANEPKQYIEITEALQGQGYNAIKINMVAVSSRNNLNAYMWASNSYVSCDQVASGGVISLRGTYAGAQTRVTIQANTEQHITLDGYNKKIIINDTEETRDKISASSPALFYVLGYPSMDSLDINMIKLKKVEILVGSTDEVLASLVPAIYNGTPCLYDTINSKAYYANSGTISVA